MAILHFRDLICWQKARLLTGYIFTITENYKDYILRDQLRRASISIMNNIAEGFGRKNVKERLRFYEISTASCYEIESMTYLFEDLKAMDKLVIENIRNQSVEVYKILSGLSQKIKKDSATN
jgi:four helix bundle protein